MTILPHDPRKSWKAKRGKRQSPEANLHGQVAGFLDKSLPPESYWFPVPNGSYIASGVYRGMMARTRQIKSGVPDICIVHKGRAIFVELKSEKGRLTDEQREAQKQILLAGAVTTVARSLEDVSSFLSMLMPLKGKVQ